MPIHLRPYLQYYDGSGDSPIQLQVDDPLHLQFAPQAGSSPRVVQGADGNPYTVGDGAVNNRGAKNVVWSSEGYVSLGNSYTGGITIPALTAAQKKATGSVLSLSTGNIGTLLGAAVPPLDFSSYRALAMLVNVVSFTGGSSPTITFELDFQDDTATPVVLPIWKSAAVSAAGSLFVSVGQGLIFPQAAAAPNLAETGFSVLTAQTGWTYSVIGLPVLPQGGFQWTVANTPTAINWSAWLYGIN